MRKITLLLMAISFVFAVNAQEVLKSKKGFVILPEVGDFSIGIDAAPFFTYAGQFLGGNANVAPTFGWTAAYPMHIYGKYMVDENTAYRAIFRLGITSAKQSEYLQQDGQADPLVTVEDSWRTTQMNIGLGAGLEKRRGSGRLQGLYGAMAMITLGTNKDSYEYGNAYSNTNMIPTRKDFGNNQQGAGWVLEDSKGTVFGFSAQAFVGVEYFFAPKMSISGEFSYGLGFTTQGDGSVTIQSWDVANSSVKTATGTTGGSSSFGLDTGVGTALNFNFYF